MSGLTVTTGEQRHSCPNTGRSARSALDARTTRHAGYTVSQRIRKRFVEIFRWGKDVRPLRKMRVRGLKSVAFMTTFIIGCCNLLRVGALQPILAPT